jgi:hypothetical protein
MIFMCIKKAIMNICSDGFKKIGSIVEYCGNGFCNYIILIIISPLRGYKGNKYIWL